jgi:hypothetical protein
MRFSGLWGVPKRQNPRRLRAGGGLKFLTLDCLGPLRRAPAYAYYAYYYDVDRKGEGENGHEVIYKTKH